MKKILIELLQFYLRSSCVDFKYTCVSNAMPPNRFYEIMSCVTQRNSLNVCLMKSVSNSDSRWQYNLESDKDKYTM